MAGFDGSVVLISGGAKGQGAHEASLLVSRGAKVVIGDILDDEGNALAESLGSAAKYVHLDVTAEKDWADAVAMAETVGPVTGLINNAGILQRARLLDTDLGLWERHLRINQTGCFLGMRTVVPAMERAGRGSIVNISSNAGFMGTPGGFAYGATKWALRGMTRSAAMDFATKNIRVNSVHPGPIDTDMIRNARTPEEHAQFVETIPMRRTGTVEEVAQLVLFLLSDDSTYITGAEIAIDGGIAA